MLNALLIATSGYNITLAQVVGPASAAYGGNVAFDISLSWVNFVPAEDTSVIATFDLVGVPVNNIACSIPSICTIVGQNLSISYTPLNPITDLSVNLTVSGVLSTSNPTFSSVVALLMAQVTNSTTTTVTKLSDLSVVIDSPSTIIAGNSITYSITVKNYGPSDAFSATVSDFWYTNSLFNLTQTGSWSCTALTLGASCSPSASTMNVVALVDLQVNSSALIVLITSVAGTSRATINTNATIAIESGATEVPYDHLQSYL